MIIITIVLLNVLSQPFQLRRSKENNVLKIASLWRLAVPDSPWQSSAISHKVQQSLCCPSYMETSHVKKFSSKLGLKSFFQPERSNQSDFNRDL